MSTPLRWSDLAGHRVGVWGLGVEGQATLRRLGDLGIRAAAVVDEAREDALSGPAGQRALAGCDVVVKSPGISRYGEDCQALVSGGVPVMGGLGLWLNSTDRARVACVTGTKGKSTTTAVAGHLAARLGVRAGIGGNIGVAPWDPEVSAEVDLWVVETSSHQCLDVELGPAVVAVTSLGSDHLDWHRGEEQYVRDKLSICRRPGVHAVLADAGSAQLRSRAGLLGPAVEWVEPVGAWAQELGLLGEHNRHNAEMARAVLLALGVQAASDEQALATAAGGFGGLPSRLRSITRAGGVEFVDDSLSTTVLPTLAAVDAFPGRRIALLVGGHDRGVDYRPLAEGLAGRAELAVFTMPASGPRIGTLLSAAGVTTSDHPDLDRAVRAASAWCRGEGVVLLAPAAPSFGVYRDYADRAADFARVATALAGVSSSA
jgi:UDP-N-acetylmuramoylalanine--D-glutamate ligase